MQTYYCALRYPSSLYEKLFSVIEFPSICVALIEVFAVVLGVQEIYDFNEVCKKLTCR